MLTDLQEIPILNQVQASLLNLLIVGGPRKGLEGTWRGRRQVQLRWMHWQVSKVR